MATRLITVNRLEDSVAITVNVDAIAYCTDIDGGGRIYLMEGTGYGANFIDTEEDASDILALTNA